jgi:hypothetical protein
MKTVRDPGWLLWHLRCRADRTPAGTPQLSSEDWAWLVTEAIRQGVGPLLYTRLSSAPGLAPGDAVERLRDVYVYNALRNGTLRQALGDVLGALHDAGIPVIVLKGAYLAEAVYDDPAVRPMADLDLMVRDASLANAEQILLALGYPRRSPHEGEPDYTAHHHTRPFVTPRGIPLELHRTIIDPRAPFRVDVDALWARATEVRIANLPTFALSPADLLVHLCLHAAYAHQFAVPLLAVCDVAAAVERFVEELDWRNLARTANAASVGGVVYCMVGLAAEMLGLDLPAAALDALTHNALDEEVITAARAYILGPAGDLPLAYQMAREQPGVAGWGRAAAHTLFPPPTTLRRIYRLPPASWAVYAYYALRPLDLLVRRGPAIGGVLARTERWQPALAREAHRLQIRRWIEALNADERG